MWWRPQPYGMRGCNPMLREQAHASQPLHLPLHVPLHLPLQAHANQLMLERAQAQAQALATAAGGTGAAAAATLPGEPELHEAEKRCQEALVRLGSAEQRALQAQQGLSSVRGECAALQAEVGAISEAFEQVELRVSVRL